VPKPPQSEPVQPSVICPRCDHDTSAKAGHVVENGKVTKCPFVDMEITAGNILNPAPDKIT
jgi:hypothetical protein